MFVVTGLNTKRRPFSGTFKSSTANRKQAVKRINPHPAVSYSYRHRQRVNPSAASSSGTAHARLEPRMTCNDNDKNACCRNEKSRPPSIKVPLGRGAPPRIRRFIPRPLVLVERMKARQLLLDSSPVASESCILPWSLTKIAMTSPLSAHVTPPTRRTPTYNSSSSDPHSSTSVSFLFLRNDTVFESGFGRMPRPVRPLSVVTLGDTSASTDTFVADSPCCVKPACNAPLLFATTDANHGHRDIEVDPGEKIVSRTSVRLFVDSVATEFVHRTRQPTDIFEPARTSTPFAPSQVNTNVISSPTSFVTSSAYPIHLSGQTPGLSDSFHTASPTSRAVYPFNAPQGTYTVKLPNSGSATSYSRLSETRANAPKRALDFRRLSNRAASPSPTLVLDGVFAIPRPSPSSSTLRTLNGFPRPRKPTTRRPLSDITNAPAIASPSRSPTLSHGEADPESPRSKLAYVLTAHARPQAMTRVHKQARVPPLVKGVQASNDPRTQCEIDGPRARRVFGLGRGDGSDIGGDAAGRGTIDRIERASVGMVARLRARWEMGAVGACVDGGA